MVGAIRKRNILAHPIVTIRCFGWMVFARALLAPRGTTFLSLLSPVEPVKPAKKPWREPIERCSNLELRAKRIFQDLADRFREYAEAFEFFTALANQEQEHYDLLQLCSIAMHRGHWKSELFAQWQKSLSGLESHMHAAERTAQLLTTLPEALELVLALECSEINFVFRGVVLSSESPFVCRLRAFNAAGEDHLTYIARCLPQLEPSLEEACRPLLEAQEKLKEASR
jgi:hypothetical protein